MLLMVVLFQIFPDDELEIINNEGNQICEIICFNKDGKSDVGILNLKSNNEKNFIRNILNGKDETILATNHQLKNLNQKISVMLFLLHLVRIWM